MRTPWVLPVLLLSALVTPASAKGLFGLQQDMRHADPGRI
jgi:hypothetical protein